MATINTIESGIKDIVEMDEKNKEEIFVRPLQEPFNSKDSGDAISGVYCFCDCGCDYLVRHTDSVSSASIVYI